MRSATVAALLAGLSVAGAAGAQPSGSVQGDWRTPGATAVVRIAPCVGSAGRLCGTVVSATPPRDAKGQPLRDRANPDPAMRTRPIIGLPILTGLSPAGAGRWSGGRIYNPQDGKTYASKLTLNPNGTLKVEGCVAVICRAQTWTRAS